jgi:hypothetical protein
MTSVLARVTADNALIIGRNIRERASYIAANQRAENKIIAAKAGW